MEGILRINSQPANLCAVHGQGARDVAGFLSVAEKRQADKVCRGEVDRIPLQHDGGLGRISAAEEGSGGGLGAEGGVDLVLETAEGELGGVFRGRVAGDGDVYY